MHKFYKEKAMVCVITSSDQVTVYKNANSAADTK